MTPETVVAPLPDFFSPVFVKELRQGLRAHRFVLPFVAAQIFAVLAVGTEFGIAAIVDAAITGGGASSDLLGRVVMWVLWGVIGVVMPLTSLAALRDELSDEKNVELLLMSNLTRWQIVRGKWLVGSALSGLIFVSMLPYILTRYFVGGLELPPLLFELCGMILANLVGTALAIGASGFRNLLGRFVLVGIGVLSYLGTWFGATGALLNRLGSRTGGGELWLYGLLLLAGGLVAALYVIYGLQLGRARLRLFENPVDPPASGLIIALMIFSPVVVAVVAAASGGYGGGVAVLGLLAIGLLIDRGPGASAAAAAYAQP
ncbi:MAG: hypothetical protein H7A52_04155 [Akkermansiaceae bacterium]|nr:hypothetical protein [Akkermansiaceae bacterium]